MKTLIRKNIIALRKIARLKPMDIAGFLGIQREIVIRYENGHQELPLEHLEKLADLFRVDLYDITETDLTQSITTSKLSLETGKFSSEDLNNISRFNRIIKNYVKLNELISLNK
jgi:predicted transcriptional regulator